MVIEYGRYRVISKGVLFLLFKSFYTFTSENKPQTLKYGNLRHILERFNVLTKYREAFGVAKIIGRHE